MFKVDAVVGNIGYLAEGLRMTILMSIVGMAGSLVFGSLLCLARRSRSLVLSLPARLYIDLMRSTPLLLIIFWFIFFLPRLTGTAFTPLASGLIALVAYFSTHVAEIMRAGIQAVPRGEVEAGLSTGLSPWQTLRAIVLPQALKNMIPALVSRFVALVKGTSLTYIIGVIEFFRAATIVNNREFASIEIFAFVAVVYFGVCFVLSRLAEWCRARLGARELGHVEAKLGW